MTTIMHLMTSVTLKRCLQALSIPVEGEIIQHFLKDWSPINDTSAATEKAQWNKFFHYISLGVGSQRSYR